MKKIKNEIDMNSNEREIAKFGVVFDEDGKVIGMNANIYAEHLAENNSWLFSKDGHFYKFENGVWVRWELKEFKKHLRDTLQSNGYKCWTTNREREYLKALESELYEKNDFNIRRNLINVGNGMYDLYQDVLLPHDPKYLSTIQLPIDYNPEADCERFERYLYEVFDGDEELIQKAIEWLGYCLSVETQAQKALILYGSGGNGKGVFTEVICLLVGDENQAHIPLNNLNKGFSRATLLNKTINISSENELNGKSMNTQYFKAVVGEDKIDAEFKGKDVFTFKPTCKLIVSINNLPQTSDISTGFFRRLDILPFNRTFTESERDSDLKQKLHQELPGIFNLAVSGLRRLRDNGYKFSKSSASDEVLEQYKVELKPIISFFEECLEEVTVDNKVAKDDIYQSFKTWASNNGHKSFAGITPHKFWRVFDEEAKRRNWNVGKGHSNKFRYRTGVKLVNAQSSSTHRKRKVRPAKKGN